MADETKPIAKEFEAYRRQVLHPLAPREQVEEVRIAFYGGACVVMNQITAAVNLGEAAAQERLRVIHAELEAHLAKIVEGGG